MTNTYSKQEKACLDDLKNLGIQSPKQLIYNPSYEDLFNYEISQTAEGLEKGFLTSSGAVAVDTGKFTGRSPKDKYIVEDDETKQHVWWSTEGSDNKAIKQEVWEDLKALSVRTLDDEKLYVIDGFCGANESTRMCVRLVTKVAWMAHFFKNMFIRPTQDELESFKPDWTILNACRAKAENYEELGLRSDVFVAFHLKERTTCIGGTWYGGEIKKGIFSIMNFFLPLKGIGSFHCSANQGESGDTALFFGLSGTGKTTLSTDPKRALIGDDEHGWDDDGIFNYEGGCYAKTIDLSAEKEPDIFKAIKRDALLENVVIGSNGNVDFSDGSKTENTRVTYPIYHIDNIVKPKSVGTHPKNIVFLTCDAYGVLPPVSILSKEQAMYQYLSGYTAKVAGTELGVTEPTATFSACFGQPFLMCHPVKYAQILGEKMEKHQSKAYLVNTGWAGGSYGVGSRMKLSITRAIIDAILSGELENVETTHLPIFGLFVPQSLTGVSTELLNPRLAWSNEKEYEQTAKKLANLFKSNFKKFESNHFASDLAAFGPQG